MKRNWHLKNLQWMICHKKKTNHTFVVDAHFFAAKSRLAYVCKGCAKLYLQTPN